MDGNCWTEGCGCDGCFGIFADGLEAVNPYMECVANTICCVGSPLAFPFVFCFDDGPETDPPGGGWRMAMIETPSRMPLKCCCFYLLCAPCGQWWMRRQLLGGDMSKYKLWQGYHDGPYCCAVFCDGAPITIRSGTYGESQCPHAFLAAEVCCLGCAGSLCCTFNVNRRMIKEERNLGNDPLENRIHKCNHFFSEIASNLSSIACCVGCVSCLVGLCAPDSEGAQECSSEGRRAANACRSCAHTCARGIISIQFIAIGCMSSQMDYEMKEGQPLASPPRIIDMDRGSDDN